MTYNQLIDILGEMDGSVAGSGNFAHCFSYVDGYRVTFSFLVNDYIWENMNGSTVSSDVLSEVNPVISSIALHNNN